MENLFSAELLKDSFATWIHKIYFVWEAKIQSYWPAHLTDKEEIYEHITCSLQEEEKKSEPAPKSDDNRNYYQQKTSFTGHKAYMILYTDVEHGPDYILQITKKIVREYQLSLAEELTRGPQIF